MELVPFLLTVFISSLGLLGGIIIAMFAKEELRSGEKYFLIAENVILTLLLILAWQQQLFALPIIAAITALTVVLLLPTRKMPPAFARLRTSPVASVLLTLYLFKSQDLETMSLFASLAFVYGIPSGTLLYMRQRKWWIGLIVRMVLMVGLAMLFQIIQS